MNLIPLYKLGQSEVAGGDIPANAAALLTEVEASPKVLLSELFSHDQEAILLGLHHNSAGNALSLYTALKGTAAMARSKVSSSDLEYVIDTMLTGIFSASEVHASSVQTMQ